MTALREIRILQLLNHENVIDLVEVCRSKGKSGCSLMEDIGMLCCCSYTIQQGEGKYLPRF